MFDNMKYSQEVQRRYPSSDRQYRDNIEAESAVE